MDWRNGEIANEKKGSRFLSVYLSELRRQVKLKDMPEGERPPKKRRNRKPKDHDSTIASKIQKMDSAAEPPFQVSVNEE